MSSVSSSPTLDTELLKSWQALSQGEDSFLKEVLILFLQTAPQTLGDMDSALQTSNLEMLARHAHKLRGSAANLGAVRLAELAGELESLVGQPDVSDGLSKQVIALRAEFANVKSRLESDYLS